MSMINTISPEAPRCLSEVCAILMQAAARRRARLAAQNEAAVAGDLGQDAATAADTPTQEDETRKGE
jgi:hypothetical protein